MKLKQKVFMVTVGLCCVLSPFLFALENKAEEALSKGKRLYADGRYEEAMDNFVDVFVSGNTDQISEANEYVNLIHFERGGVVPPKQVPYDAELEKRQNLGVRGNELTAKNSKEQDAIKTVKQTEYSKQIFIKDDIGDDIPEPPSSEPEANPFGYQVSQQTFSEDSENAGIYTEGKEVVQAKTTSKEEAKDSAKDVVEDASADTPKAMQYAKGQVTEDDEFIMLEGPIDIKKDKDVISNETPFPKGSKSKIRSMQKEKEKQQRQELIDYLVARLNANDDVQVYMRGGRVDAIDMNSASVFSGKSVNRESTAILDDVYALMILENAPSYVILPTGSYTDDVTLYGVRQAVSLNSYLINRGISPSKMNLNMGLTTQEPPEKFSNLAGTSIVFDYEGSARLKSKLKEKNLPPVLSLAVYPFKEIVPSAGEVFVIDFSVMEASAPIKEWVLQIVSHAADNHYYVVKQLSGDGALNYQTFWNGHKRYFGNVLPLGKYTVVLRAKDTAGREKLLKRQLILKEADQSTGTVVKKESEVLKAEEFKRIKAEQEAKKAKAKQEALKKAKEQKSNLDYSQARLWKKPGKKMVGEVQSSSESTMVVSTNSSVENGTQTTVESSIKSSTVYESSTSTSSTSTSSEGLTDMPQEYETSTDVSSYGGTSNPYANTEEGESSNPYEF